MLSACRTLIPDSFIDLQTVWDKVPISEQWALLLFPACNSMWSVQKDTMTLKKAAAGDALSAFFRVVSSCFNRAVSHNRTEGTLLKEFFFFFCCHMHILLQNYCDTIAPFLDTLHASGCLTMAVSALVSASQPASNASLIYLEVLHEHEPRPFISVSSNLYRACFVFLFCYLSSVWSFLKE